MVNAMIVKQVTPILNVVNVPKSLTWFESLGWSISFTWNASGTITNAEYRNAHGEAVFAGVCSNKAEIFLCKDAQGSRGGDIPRHVTHDDSGGVWMSWWLESAAEVDQLYAKVVELEYDAPYSPRDEPWGVREFLLRHPDGHTMRVGAESSTV